MKPSIPSLLFIASILTCSSFARIGETQQQIEARYGRAKSHTPKHAQEGNSYPETWVYEKDGIEIMLNFGEQGETRSGFSVQGRSVWERYLVKGKMTEATLNTLLDANKGASTWNPPTTEFISDGVYGNRFETKDKSRTAYFSKAMYQNVVGAGESLSVIWENTSKTPKGF